MGRARRVRGCASTELPSIDLTRRVARARPRRRGRAPPIAGSPGLTAERVRDIAAVLLAAEAIGVAQWCVDTAAEYAKVRVQFGRPIGQFQGVKHRCADMLARTELARAAVWDAAARRRRRRQRRRARDRGRRGARVRRRVPQRRRTACRRSAASASRGSTTRTSICGARSTLHQLVGHARRRGACARARAVQRRRAAPARGRPRPEAEAHRDRGARVPRRDQGPRRAREQRDRLADDGLPHAGLAAAVGPRRRRARAARDRRGVPRREGARAPNIGVGAWALPTLIVYGTPEQQERWILPTLRGEISWCQLFSEPGAGSDLAALSTRADARRRRLGAQRPEGVDVDGQGGRLGHLPRPHRSRRARSTTASRASWST